jgi:hypothetical protein
VNERISGVVVVVVERGEAMRRSTSWGSNSAEVIFLESLFFAFRRREGDTYSVGSLRMG